jgi:hypothetical protein
MPCSRYIVNPTTATTSTARIAAHRRLAKPLIEGVFIQTPFQEQ